MVTKKSVLIYLVAVFAAGLLAGGAGGYSLGKRKAFRPPRPQEMTTHMCDHLKARLHLTPEQVKQIEPSIQQTAEELDAVHTSSAKRIADIFQRSNQRLTQYLTPEQKHSLDDMDRERQQFLGRNFKSPRPGQPPPPGRFPQGDNHSSDPKSK